MDRRDFVTGGLVGLAALALPDLAAAQVTRPGWSPTGPLTGRQAQNPAQLTSSEQRHVPVLRLPARPRADRSFDLVVQIGPNPHVMQTAHYIDWVEVAVGTERVFITDLSARVTYPILRVPMRLSASATITARAHCNLHGTWMTRRQVTVA